MSYLNLGVLLESILAGQDYFFLSLCVVFMRKARTEFHVIKHNISLYPTVPVSIP